MTSLMAELEASIQQRVDADSDFQTAISTLSDEEKNVKIAERKSEELDKEISTLKAGSEEAKAAKELANNQKIRAEKAEKALKEKTGEVLSKEDYSPQEIIALGKLHEEDVERVIKWAKANGQKINEALKDGDLKTILEKREEERRTAAATQMRGGQRSGSGSTGDELLRKARGGELPEDDASMMALVEADLSRKIKK